ncbi:MAG: DUF1553 domain-containing protein [Planctomycetes bacterium]|nr:DUF1553 domain-containing protein [Planctomycetota bacterium]
MVRTFFSLPLIASLFIIGTAVGQESLPPNAKVVKLEVRPAKLELKSPFDYKQLLVDATLDNGDVIDVTRLATFTPSAKLVALSPNGLVRPTADGKGELKISTGGQTISAPIVVTGFKDPYQVSFVRDVMPAMSKLGCNAGTCHGSLEGKNGFKLSLRGYDPIFDHRALTDDLEGRRFNRAAPERSLMLMKPSGAIPHVGGVLWQPGDPSYELLKMWISEGVKLDLSAGKVASLEVLPRERIIPRLGQKQQMVVMATYGDGSKRDVTAEAFIESSNTEVATVDKLGVVSTIRRGESTMLARYEGAYAASALIVMGDRGTFQWSNPESFNHIDDLVYEKLKKVKVLPSELCTDAEFIRRVTIDLTGLPPQPENVRAFIEDKSPTRVKRDKLIDQLIGSEEFVDHWTNKWADLLQVNRKFLGDVGAKKLREYIRTAISTNMPYDKFAYEILTATGSNAEKGPASYYKVLRTPDAVMENTTHLFLAIRFNCNKCHDHPFERWTQDQYYNMASYFAHVSRARDPKYPGNIGGSAVEGALPLVEIITDTTSGDVRHDRTGELVKPKFPYEIKGMPADTLPRRTQLAKWITSPENPYFAKSYVNRIWSYMLGVGIVEPIDDIRAGNPASNPALLDRLAKDFIDSKFDVRTLMKTICQSRTYQLSIKTNKWNDGDDINYSHALARRLPAEALYDAIHRVTGSNSKLPGLPPGARAAQVIDGSVDLPSGFLELFGKPLRESACECERSSGLMLGPILNLVNGPIVADAIKDPNNRIAKLAATVKDDAKFVEEIYLATLSQLPTPAQMKLGLQAIKDAESDYKALAADYEKRQNALKEYEKKLDAKQIAWEKDLGVEPKWEVLQPDERRTTAKNRKGTSINVGKDGTLSVTGENPATETYTVEATTKLARVTGVRLEVLADDRLPAKGPGRAPNGNFVLSEFKLSAQPLGQPEPKPAVLQNAKATFAQAMMPISNAIDGQLNTGWAVSPQFGKNQSALFELKDPIISEVGTKVILVLDQQFGMQHNLGKFRLSVTSDSLPRLDNTLPPELAAIVKTPVEKRTADQKAKLRQMFLAQDVEYKRMSSELTGNPLPGNFRVLGGQDLMWALLNNPAFLFNH